ncbi:hypothetical protein MCERE19_03849 [Spirosomataceae bacterium]
MKKSQKTILFISDIMLIMNYLEDLDIMLR